MNNPSSSVGQAIIANANYETAAICTLTNNQPATACTPDDPEARRHPRQVVGTGGLRSGPPRR